MTYSLARNWATSLVLLCSLATAHAFVPAWWVEHKVVPGDVDQTTTAVITANYQPALIGQAKNMAYQAYVAMEAKQTGSAGTAIEDLVNQFSTDLDDNYAPLLIGQLKAIAQPFYDRFAEVGYEFGDIPVNASGYPWDDTTPVDDNYYPANLGQLKHVFSFDLTAWGISESDTDADGMADSFELQIVNASPLFTTVADVQPNDDFDRDGYTNLYEFTHGLSPIDYYNGNLPEMDIYTGHQQIGLPGEFAVVPLSVRMVPFLPADDDLHQYPESAPVDFRVTAGDGAFANTIGGIPLPESHVTTRADRLGVASIYFQFPTTYYATITVEASVTVGDSRVVQTFTLFPIGAERGTVAAGGDSSYYAKPAATIKAWGRNQFGQLGHSDATPQLEPIDTQLTAASTPYVAAGLHHAFALDDSGMWHTAGKNNHQQLLRGAYDYFHAMHADLVSSMFVPAITAGTDHTVVLLTDGRLMAWGSNAFGQLGNGTLLASATPTLVTRVKQAKVLAAGAFHNLVIDENGQVWAWGSNFMGQLGDGSTIDALAPVKVALPSPAIAIAAGRTHSLAVLQDGTVWSWGANGFGELGLGTHTPSVEPQPLAGLDAIVAVASGAHFNVALAHDGSLWVWGANWAGQLGNGNNTDRSTPQQLIIAGERVVQVACGANHVCALTQSNQLYVWGYNTHGQLGLSDTVSRHTPIKLF